ncbi:hypothetical protein IWW38_006517, partial [Coemansia aciculifera]
GSPVYLSPGDFALSYEVHRMQREASGSQPESAATTTTSNVTSPHPAVTAESGKLPASSSSALRQPLLANLKIDELHVAGHGNVDVVESTPTITLRYSSDLPADVQKQTMALKNELVGIEEDSGSEKGESSAESPPPSS